MKITALIIEDEPASARYLERLLTPHEIDVLDKLDSVEDAIDWLKSHPSPELLFLDIQLSDGLSFEILDEVSVESFIIFTTAYDQYALKAFSFNSIDYLLKPIQEKDLKRAIDKYHSFQKAEVKETENHRDTIKDILENHFQVSGYKNRFFIQTGSQIKTIDKEHVRAIISDQRNVFLLSDGQEFLINESLDALEKSLNPNEFFRASRSAIVQLKGMEKIEIYGRQQLKISICGTDKEIIVSREKVKQFKDWLGR